MSQVSDLQNLLAYVSHVINLINTLNVYLFLMGYPRESNLNIN